MTRKKIVSLLLGFLCANCMCIVFQFTLSVSTAESKTIVAVATKTITSEKKSLMHILYHAPFALNSFNIYFFFVEFVCLLSAFFFFFFSLSALYLLQFSLFIYRRCRILNTELHILCSSALLPVSIFA